MKHTKTRFGKVVRVTITDKGWSSTDGQAGRSASKKDAIGDAVTAVSKRQEAKKAGSCLESFLLLLLTCSYLMSLQIILIWNHVIPFCLPSIILMALL